MPLVITGGWEVLSMRMSGRYAPGLYAGVTGFLALVAINAFSIPDSLTQAKERDRITVSAQLEQAQAEAAKKVADAYSKNGIANFDQLIISNYTLSNTPPRLDWRRTVDQSKKTIIYDKNRQCLGYALAGKFYFTRYYEGVCNDGTR
jgi:hypothetical protein